MTLTLSLDKVSIFLNIKGKIENLENTEPNF